MWTIAALPPRKMSACKPTIKQAVVLWEDLEKTGESSLGLLVDVPVPYQRKGRGIRIRVFLKTVACLI
jgi:hypothetical protein